MKRTLDEDLLSLITAHVQETRMACAARLYPDKDRADQVLRMQRRNLKRYAAFVKRWSKP